MKKVTFWFLVVFVLAEGGVAVCAILDNTLKNTAFFNLFENLYIHMACFDHTHVPVFSLIPLT